MEDWNYQTASNLDQPFVERLRQFPREPEMLVYILRSAAALLIRAWLRVYHRLEIAGTEHLPRGSSFVLVANHTSHLDTLSILSAVPLSRLHQTFPAAAADYFFKSIPRAALAAIVVNALPFQREVHIRNSLTLCRELLVNPGNILLLFPEGTRTTTGKMGRFKPGVGLLLAGLEVPVVPCYLEGAFEAWPKGAWIPRPRKIKLTFGTPRSFTGLPANKESALKISSDLEGAVRELAPAQDRA